MHFLSFVAYDIHQYCSNCSDNCSECDMFCFRISIGLRRFIDDGSENGDKHVLFTGETQGCPRAVLVASAVGRVATPFLGQLPLGCLMER